jgi:hypothetical protein
MARIEGRLPANLGDIASFRVFGSAQFATGGVGLRNRPGGTIEVSGVVKPVKATYLYWAVITQGAAPDRVRSLRIRRLHPTPSAAAVVDGTTVGTGASPCWGGNRTTVFRAAVPRSIANGNGTYSVALNADAGGSTAGGDPWAGSPLPAWEGASLVVVGTGSDKVAIYDRKLAGKTFHGDPGLRYDLLLPTGAAGSSRALFHSIGADGQRGESLEAIPPAAREVTTVNGVAVAGPGSAGRNGDWNGDAAAPLGQLWDDTGHDITDALQAGGAAQLRIRITASGPGSDCLVPVANVVSF